MVDKKGPGFYNVDPTTLGGPKFTIRKKGVGPKNVHELVKTPGPGKYDPENPRLNKSKSCSMFWHRPNIRHDFKIGPGSYRIEQQIGNPAVPLR